MEVDESSSDEIEAEKKLGREKEISKVKVKGTGQGGRSRSKVTERDGEIVRWLGRHRLATAEQVMRRFEMQRSKAYQRLAVLVDCGLVRHDTGVRSARIYLATPKGLAAAGLDLPRGDVSPATAAHDLAVVDAAISLEGSTIQIVLTEREIRRADQRGEAQFRIAAWGTPDTPDQRGMWPDLVTIDRLSGKLQAIEVELTLKKHERIADKLRAYANSRYTSVIYQCATEGIARAVALAGARSGMTDRLAIERTAQRAATVRPDGDRERLLAVVRDERARADELAQRVAEALRQLDGERATGLALIDEMARYLAADRAEQRATRERWHALIERVARSRQVTNARS